MTDVHDETYPCAGATEADGCAAFERYFANESAFLEQYREDLDPDVEEGVDIRRKVSLLDDPEELRRQVYEDFVASGFCVLAYVRARGGHENVIQLHQRDTQFEGCVPAREHLAAQKARKALRRHRR